MRINKERLHALEAVMEKLHEKGKFDCLFFKFMFSSSLFSKSKCEHNKIFNKSIIQYFYQSNKSINQINIVDLTM